jgi:aspartate/methionine/tyrosine aminotransferase
VDDRSLADSASSGIRVARRVADAGVSIFTEMSALARSHGAVNLGQGYPDSPGPDWVKEAAVSAIPPTAFYTPRNRHLGRQLARFAFCKRMETLAEAAHRLQTWSAARSSGRR